MTNRLIIFWHVSVWLIFISYEVAFLFFTVGIKASFFHFALYYFFNIFLFYFNAYVLLDFAFFKTNQPYFVASASIIIELAIYLIIKFSLDYLLSGAHYNYVSNLKQAELYIMTNIWRGIYFIGLSTGYWSMRYMLRYKERNHHMETEQLKAIARNLELENKVITTENAYLQNQVSPHLLFNTLNFIYNKVRKLSDKAGEGVMLLADLMRYSLATSEDTGLVLLSQEVAQIENLIRLSTLRNENELFIKFIRKGKMTGIRIIPLVLITLVENIVKHGDLGEADHQAVIRLTVEREKLMFEATNKKRAGSPYQKGGLGLKNIEKRLKNAYPNHYHLSVTDAGVFSVSLTIDL